MIQQRHTIYIRTRPGGPEALWGVPNVRTKKKIGKKYPIEASGFSAAGKTICVVTGEECRVEDFVGVGRDMRVECRDTDVQLGHVDARRDTALSIRGGNLLPMSRRGNLIMGERNFMEDAWVDELRRIINRFRGSTVPG